MEYFTDNLNIISAEIEKARLEKELALLRTIEDGRRRKARDEAKMILLKPEKLYYPESIDKEIGRSML